MTDLSTRTTDDGKQTYDDTVARGFYARSVGGLWGKHDNVRTYWEDDLTRVALRRIVKERAGACKAVGRGVRILDLGCGAGQGYELLTRIDHSDLDLHDAHRYVLVPESIERYLGLDISEAMVGKARENYRGLSGVRFCQRDLRDGLGPALAEAPFDIYFSSYAALSHLDRSELARCLGEIACHAAPGAVVVLDLVGRYSLEWPAYWGAETEHEKVRPYSMSYLYPEAERRSGAVERFNLRFWTGEEVDQLCTEVSEAHQVPVRALERIDRSIFVGRHVDTGEYGTCLPPLRSLVNQLYEHNVRTQLDRLHIAYRAVAGAAELNRFFAGAAAAWNVLIEFTIDRLEGRRINLVEMEGWAAFPPAVQMALVTLDRLIDSVAWIDIGDVRANIIEPQLAYVLRRMVHRLQQGRGCGHGLVAILQIGASAAQRRMAHS